MTKKKESAIAIESTINPTEAIRYVGHCVSKQRPIFLWGSPGIGKSDIIREIAKAQGRQVVDIRLILMGPEDLKGIPYFNSNENTMRWAPTSELPQFTTEEEVAAQKKIVTTYAHLASVLSEETANVEGMDSAELVSKIDALETATSKLKAAEERLVVMERYLIQQDAILLLDEMNSAPQSVQGAAYQLVLDRKVGEYSLPDGVSIVAAGNLMTDKGVTYKMPTPLANRFVHLQMNSDPEAWQEWAIENKVNSDVVGFIAANPSKLHMFDPKKADLAFPTPRSWVSVSKLLDEGLDYPMTSSLVGGTVGAGTAVEFIAHRKIASKLPKPDEVLAGLIKTLQIDETSAKYAITIGCNYRLIEQFGNTKKEGSITLDEFNTLLDNYYRFLLDVMAPEMIILGLSQSLKQLKAAGYKLDRDAVKSFKEIYEGYGSMVLNA